MSESFLSSVALASIGESTLTLGALSPIATNLLIGVFLVISLAMILLVLIQRPEGGGLSGAFGSGGGSGAGQTAFGTKTGDVLTYATIGIFLCFLLFAIILNFATRPAGPASNETILNAPAGTSSESTPDSTSEEAGDDETATELIDLSGAVEELTNELNEEGVEGTQTPETAPGELPTEVPAEVPTENPVDNPSGTPVTDPAIDD